MDIPRIRTVIKPTSSESSSNWVSSTKRFTDTGNSFFRFVRNVKDYGPYAMMTAASLAAMFGMSGAANYLREGAAQLRRQRTENLHN